MVDVRVLFKHTCAGGAVKEWSHEFNVQRGCTIRRLKQVMLLPDGTEDDAKMFELRRGGRRVPDYEKVWNECNFNFQYLGADEGLRKTKLDEAREAGTAEEEVALTGRWLVANQDGSGDQVFVYRFKHRPGDKKLEGILENVGPISDGRVEGKVVSWNINEFSLVGRVGDGSRTISDIKVYLTRNNLQVGVLAARRLHEASAWSRHQHHDLRGRKDVEQMDGKDIDAVKRHVEKMGYAGFSMWRNTAFLKGGGRPLTTSDLDFLGETSEVTFHLFSPPDPYENEEDDYEDDDDDDDDVSNDVDDKAEGAATAKGEANKKDSNSQGEAAAQEEGKKGKMQQQQQQQTQKQEKKQQQQPTAPAVVKDDEPEVIEEVEVLIKHALPDKASQVTLIVMSDDTIGNIRKELAKLLGLSRMSEIRLVKRAGSGFTSLEDSQPLGKRSELLFMGPKLEAVHSQSNNNNNSTNHTGPSAFTPIATAAPPATAAAGTTLRTATTTSTSNSTATATSDGLQPGIPRSFGPPQVFGPPTSFAPSSSLPKTPEDSSVEGTAAAAEGEAVAATATATATSAAAAAAATPSAATPSAAEAPAAESTTQPVPAPSGVDTGSNEKDTSNNISSNEKDSSNNIGSSENDSSRNSTSNTLPVAAAELVSIVITDTEDEDIAVQAHLPSNVRIEVLKELLLYGSGTPAEEVEVYVYDEFFDKVDRILGNHETLGGLEKQDRPYLRIRGTSLSVENFEGAKAQRFPA